MVSLDGGEQDGGFVPGGLPLLFFVVMRRVVTSRVVTYKYSC